MRVLHCLSFSLESFRSMSSLRQRLPFRFPLAFLFIGVGAFIPVSAAAQGSGVVAGEVRDASTGEPLPGANVLIGSTTLGASTGLDGRFEIEDVPIGPWTVAASMVGYESRSDDVALWNESDTLFVRFRLRPQVYDLDEIEVTAERTSGWDREYRLFRELFLGESSNAEKTVITNPFVLDFRRSDLVFFASASAPLIIENRALGYRLTYVLRSFRWSRNPDRLSFQGEPYFEEMEPADEEESMTWHENRALTFRGSRQHFLWALGRDRVEEEGFTMERGALDERPGEILPVRSAGLIQADDIVASNSSTHRYIVSFEGHVIVSYEIKSTLYLFGVIPLPNTDIQRSVMRMDAREAMIHLMGYFLGPPGALGFAGHWGNERIADLLPLDYVRIWEQYARPAETRSRM